MTTLLHKTNSRKKARAISSGSLEIISSFVLSTRQVLAGNSLRLILILILIHRKCNINTTTSRKSVKRALRTIDIGGAQCIITSTT